MAPSSINIPGLDDEDIALLPNARNFAYFCNMVEQIRKGECPFCTLDEKLNTVLQTRGRWRVWECPEQFRADHIERHFVIAPEQHITHTKEMTGEDKTSLACWVSDTLPGGGVVMRFGDPRRNAQSMRHLHCNVIMPDGTGEYKATLAKDPDKVRAGVRRTKVFAKLLENGARPENVAELARDILTDEEHALVQGRL